MRLSAQFGYILLFLWFLSVPPALAQDPPEGAIGVTEPSAADREMGNRLRSIYREIPGLEEVEVEVRAGVIRLTGEVPDIEQRQRAVTIAGRMEGQVAIEEDIAINTAVADRFSPTVERFENYWADIVVYVPLLLIAIVVLAVFVAVGRYFSRRKRMLGRMAKNSFVRDLLGQVIFLLFFLVGLLVALDILGATALFGSVLGAAGIVGLAVGFGLKDTVENYIASVLLSIRQPFAPNDYIVLGDVQGMVSRLTSRATILITFDGNHVRIPNATVFRSTITNYTRSPERRFMAQIAIALDSDLVHAQEVALKAIQDMPDVLDDPGPFARVLRIGEYNVVIAVFGWVNQRQSDYGLVESNAIVEVKAALERAGITVPVPVYTVKPLAEKSAPAGEDERRPAQPSTAVAQLGERADTVISEKASEERLQGDTSDLLDPEAPRE